MIDVWCFCWLCGYLTDCLSGAVIPHIGIIKVLNQIKKKTVMQRLSMKIVYALSEIDSFVDITEDDLLRIYALATDNKDQ